LKSKISIPGLSFGVYEPIINSYVVSAKREEKKLFNVMSKTEIIINVLV
jgi:hypothetical protein